MSDDLLPDVDPQETAEWIDSLRSLIDVHGTQRAEFVLQRLLSRAKDLQVPIPGLIRTHYINTIDPKDEADYPGDEELELRIRRIIRWNAVAMVVKANREGRGVGGHLATYASSASLYEVGFNHFFRGPDKDGSGDQIYMQGHAAPGIYSRAFLEGRLSEEQLQYFRQENGNGVGLSSYPHPRLMPDFWEFPTVSMGLGPISAIYQARFNKYLTARGIKDLSNNKVWCFVGDGEVDEVETIGAIDLAAREGLDNLIFVINCNLQRLDGPVRGNSKIVQELEGHFRGMGWNVLKVLWGRGWDKLLEKDTHGILVQALNDMLDGEAQAYSIASPQELRKQFFGQDPRLLKMVSHLEDSDLKNLRRGGHDYRKVYSAYKAAFETKGQPTVILAKTVKGWTLGEEIMAKNVTHQRKAMSIDELRRFRDQLELEIPDSQLTDDPPFFHPGDASPEVQYIKERRQALSGYVPQRKYTPEKIELPQTDLYDEFYQGTSEKQQVSTTMAYVRLLSKLMRDPKIGRRIVPIIPDEARTFGMHTMFPEFGIYAPNGQLYSPVDKEKMLYYREEKDGQVLEEGITEAGSMASFQAAGTAYATHSVVTIPFYTFYSMFGLQRTGDQVWQFGDIRGRGFLMGATAGRTTLNGEGLQHEDGHSLLLASVVPNLNAYDPAFGYEIAAIIEDGLHSMYDKAEDVFYYITTYNENYQMPAAPEHLERQSLKEGILNGLYLFKPGSDAKAADLQIFMSGSINGDAIAAQSYLQEKFGVNANLWSATSYGQLRRDALKVDREKWLNPDTEKTSYLEKTLNGYNGPIVAVSDFVKSVPGLISPWLGNRLHTLGTDGFGMSNTRPYLRKHFEVDKAAIVLRSLFSLLEGGGISREQYQSELKEFGFDLEKTDPLSI